MIVESPAALRLMATLMEVGEEGATREHLVQKADIGTTTFYRLVGALVDRGVVVVESNRYRVPLGSFYGFRFKLWHDAERLLRLPPVDQAAALEVLHAARRALGPKLLALWLVGSAADGSLTDASDLDFVAITDGQSSFHPPSTSGRPINFVSLGEADFRERLHRQDGFVLSALRYGVLLFDRELAQQLYSRPLPVAIPVDVAHAEDSATEQLRTRALALLESNDLDASREALKAFAISVARLMLRAFGELPPNRASLLEAAAAYFGGPFGKALSEALAPSPVTRRSIVDSARRLSDYHRAFQGQAHHLVTFAALPRAEGTSLEALCCQVLSEIAGGDETVERKDGRRDVGVDVEIATRGGSRFYVQMKSLTGALTVNQVLEVAARTAPRTTGRRAGRVILICNAHRDLPALERPAAVSPSALAAAKRHHVTLLSGLDVLRAHHVHHLEPELRGHVLRRLLDGRPI